MNKGIFQTFLSGGMVIWSYGSILTVTFTCLDEISVVRIDPKKSVIGTLFGSLGYKSLRTPTVEMHRRFGHTFNYSRHNKIGISSQMSTDSDTAGMA